MKLIQYTNGNKVVVEPNTDTNTNVNPATRARVAAAAATPKRIITKVTQAPPAATPNTSKGCGCGK